jgi:hypothetical protein
VHVRVCVCVCVFSDRISLCSAGWSQISDAPALAS